jgi:hypothetical protein
MMWATGFREFWGRVLTGLALFPADERTRPLVAHVAQHHRLAFWKNAASS